MEKAHAYLRSLEDWLLVLDGTDPTTVSQYLPPPTQRGHIIITTRLPPNSQEKASPPGYASIDLLLLDDAIASLLRRTGTTVKATDLTAEDRLALKQLVGDHCWLAYPLSLDLAAAIIRKRHSSYAGFKKLFDEALSKATTAFPPFARADYDNNPSDAEYSSSNSVASDHHVSSVSPLSMAKTFPIGTTNAAVHSLIKMMLEEISMGARWILYCCCSLNCESIPVRLLTDMATKMGEVYMNEFSVETDEVVSKENAHLYIAETYSTSLLKKHRHTIVVKHQYFNVQEQERGREVVSLHPFVQQCLWDYLPDVYYPFIAHSCAAALVDSLSDRSDPLPLDLLAAHALTFCSRLPEKRHIHLSANAIQSCRQVMEGVNSILLRRREFSEAFQRFLELSGEITCKFINLIDIVTVCKFVVVALLKYDPRDRALLDMFSKLLEGNHELFSSDVVSNDFQYELVFASFYVLCTRAQATLGQRSVNDLVALDVREDSRCVVLTPLRKADEERLSCTDFFVRGQFSCSQRRKLLPDSLVVPVSVGAGRLIRLQQAFHQDSSFFRGCHDQDLLKITRDIVLALKSIHDDGNIAQLLRTRVTSESNTLTFVYTVLQHVCVLLSLADRILIDKSEMCAWLVVTEFDTVSVQDCSSWLLKADYEDRRGPSRERSSSSQTPERASSTAVSQLRPKDSEGQAKDDVSAVSVGSREKPPSDLGDSVSTSGLPSGAANHTVSTFQGDSAYTSAPYATAPIPEPGAQEPRSAPSDDVKDRSTVGTVEVTARAGYGDISSANMRTDDSDLDTEGTTQFGSVTGSEMTHSGGSTADSVLVPPSPGEL